MNAPAHIPPDLTPHLFDYDEMMAMVQAGILPGKAGIELIDGRLLMRSSDKPYRFTLSEVRQMVEVGILAEDARVELIDGEVIDMAPQNAPHMYAKHELYRTLAENLDRSFVIQIEGTLALANGIAPCPDIFIHSASKRVDKLTGADVLLLIEVADSSILRDLRAKAALYARFGIADYWVVDACGRRIFIHRQPGPTGYDEVFEADRDAVVSPLAIPTLAVRVGDLPS